MKSLFTQNKNKSLFDQTKMIYLYIQTSLKNISNNAQNNIDLIDIILLKISKFNNNIINLLLQILRESYYNKIEKKLLSIEYKLSTFLGLSEEYQEYLQSNGKKHIPTNPIIKELLDLILSNRCK